MKNNKQNPTHPEKTNFKKLPQLQKLQLEQLEGLAGGLIITIGNFSTGVKKNHNEIIVNALNL